MHLSKQATDSLFRTFFSRIGLSHKDWDWIVKNWEVFEKGEQHKLYQEFEIREGRKRRKIEAPCFQLKRIQRVIAKRFLERIYVAGAAHGFVPRCSQKTNAKRHLKDPVSWHRRKIRNICLLEVDIRDFFPSIPMAKVYWAVNLVLRRRFDSEKWNEGFQGLVLELLVGLLVIRNRAPMGAPSTPYLSNLILMKFDSDMTKYATRWGLIYTRYADDITFSGVAANKAYKKVKYALKYWGFSLNRRKTRVLRPHRNMAITGITINTGEMTVSRKYRRRLRAMIHQTRLHMEVGQPSRPHDLLVNELRPESLTRLRGMAQWCAAVNPRHTGFLTDVKELVEAKASRSS